MSWFTKKQKLKETPLEEMKCGCGYPIPRPFGIVEGGTRKRIIRQVKHVCSKCEKVTFHNG